MICVSATMLIAVSMVAMDSNAAEPASSEVSSTVDAAVDTSSQKWLDSFDEAKSLSNQKKTSRSFCISRLYGAVHVGRWILQS